MFRFIAVGGEDFVAASGGDHEGFVATGLNTVVDRNVPLIKRWADGLDFAFDGRLDGREIAQLSSAGKAQRTACCRNTLTFTR